MNMNFNLHLCLALVLSGGLFFGAGCRGIGTQQYKALAPAQTRELESSSRTVLDVTCISQTAQADYNLWENLSMLAPTPKYWKLDLTLKVDRVVKGDFNEKTLEDSLAAGADQGAICFAGYRSCSSIIRRFHERTPLRIGFAERSREKIAKPENNASTMKPKLLLRLALF